MDNKSTEEIVKVIEGGGSFDALIKLWEHLGLLDGLDGNVKELCVVNYSGIAKLLINNDEQVDDKWKQRNVMLFPIVRRITVEQNILIDPEHLLKSYDVEIPLMKNFLDNLFETRKVEDFDLEAELVRLFAFMYCPEEKVDMACSCVMGDDHILHMKETD